MHLLIDYIRQFGRFQRNARLYLISNALSGVSVGIAVVLYNLYLVSLGYRADFIGAILFSATIGAAIAIFPAGVCVDRFGGKVVLIGSSLIIGVAGAGQILFRQPIPLLVSGFFAGVAGAALLVVNAPFLTANSTPDERPHLFSLNIVLSLVTTVLGEVLGGALPQWFRSISWFMAPLPQGITWLLASQPEPRSYQLALLFAGVIAAPSLIPLFLLRNDGPARISEERVHLPGPVVPPPRPMAPPRGATTFWWTIVDAIRQISLPTILQSPLFILVLVQVLVGLGAGLFIPYFNIYFVQHLKASSELFGLIDGGANTINALLTLVVPWLAMRIGKVNTIALTRLISIPLLLTIGLTNILPVAALLYLFRQGMMDMSLGILQVFSMEVVSEQHRGLANSSYQASFQAAWALTAPLGGLIIVHFGYSPIFVIGAVCYLLSIAVLWGRFGWRKEKRSGYQVESGPGQMPPEASRLDVSSEELLPS
jgi:MFS family permease